MCIVWQDEKGKFVTQRILFLPKPKAKAYFNDSGYVFGITRMLIIFSANAQSLNPHTALLCIMKFSQTCQTSSLLPPSCHAISSVPHTRAPDDIT